MDFRLDLWASSIDGYVMKKTIRFSKLAVFAQVSLLGLGLLFVPRTASALELRKWTNLKGQVIEAELVRVSGDTVILKSKEGTQFAPLKLKELSKADQDYVAEVAAKEPSLGAPPKESKKVVSPAKEAKFDKKTAFRPTGKKFPIGEKSETVFEITESDHFAVIHEPKSDKEAIELLETCERLWLDMNFFHPTFAAKFQDRKKAYFLCDSTEVYLELGKWYSDLIAKSDIPNALDLAARIDNGFKASSSSGLNLPGALAEEFKFLTDATAMKSFSGGDGEGMRPQKIRGVFTPSRVHAVASDLFGLQAGGASEFAKAGWTALSVGHGYYKEIQIAGKSETVLISGAGSDGAVSQNPIYQDNWADSLRKAMRGNYKPTIKEIWSYESPVPNPAVSAAMMSWAAFLQSTPDRVSKYAEMVGRIDTGNQVPSMEDVAKIYGFDGVPALETAWLEFIKSSSFK